MSSFSPKWFIVFFHFLFAWPFAIVGYLASHVAASFEIGWNAHKRIGEWVLGYPRGSE